MERFGFIRDKLEIKILILFIMQRLPDGVPLEMLADVALCDEGISYFDFAECVSELCSTGHLEKQDDLYFITEKGVRNGKTTESGIPYSVRIKAERSTLELSNVLRRRAMIKAVSSGRDDGGYTVSLAVSDGVSNILDIDILAGTAEQAEAIKKNFRKNAEHIYNAVIDVLLDKKD